MTQSFDLSKFRNEFLQSGGWKVSDCYKPYEDKFLRKDAQDAYEGAKWGFEVGAQSRQIEIDELKKELEILQGMHNAVILTAGDLLDERDELRSIFESKTEIARHLKAGYIFWDGSNYQLNQKNDFDKSHEMYPIHNLNLGWVRGTWWMFQEIYQAEYNKGDKVIFVKNKQVDGEYFPIEIGQEFEVFGLHESEKEKWLNCDGWALTYDQVVKK